MQLHGNQWPLLTPLHDILQTHCLHELLELLEIGVLERRPKIHEKDFAGH
jgi:hypothetical protein